MGLRTLTDGKRAIMYCSTTDWGFGPVFDSDEEHDAFDRVESFLRWFAKNSTPRYDDPRSLTDRELESKYSDWLAQEAAQWKAEEEAENARWSDDE